MASNANKKQQQQNEIQASKEHHRLSRNQTMKRIAYQRHDRYTPKNLPNTGNSSSMPLGHGQGRGKGGEHKSKQ